MPSFSAKVYEQLNHTRTVADENVLEQVYGHPERILSLLAANHTLGVPQPIFREIHLEEVQKWKQEFGGNE